MKISVVKKNLKYIFAGEQSITPFLWGKPGIGKSQLVAQVAKELGIGFIDLRLSQVDSTDLRGIPHGVPEEGLCKWLPPEFLPFEFLKKFDVEFPKGGILLLDEFNRARPDVLQSAFQLVLDRSVGLNKIRKNWFIVAAGNLGMEDRTDVVEMDSALKNRFIHFNVDVNLDDWIDWAEKAKIHSDVMNFIRGKPNQLYQAASKDEDNVFVTPRSWEKFSDILNNNASINPIEITESLGMNIINGAAPHFIKYLESKELVPPKDVLNNYKTVKSKLQSMGRDQLYSLNTEISAYIVDKLKTLEDNQIDNLHDYGHDFLEKDIYIAFLQDLTKKCLAAKKVDWINRYLRKYIDESSEIVEILKKK